MPLGIRATVDFAFKKIFGSPENSAALIGLLNAILKLALPIVSVEVLNPFNYQEFVKSKLIVLDVRCRDSAGRRLNVEMQVSVHAGLLQRLVYYACSMYVDQLAPGGDYTSVAPSISICLLDQVLFADSDQPHHRFAMVDQRSGRALTEAIEVHTLELRKYELDERTITRSDKIQQWAFLLLRGQDYTAESLRRLLPGIEFATAIRAMEAISAKTEDKQMYDQRQKAQMDYDWAMSSARKEGLEQGRQEGREEGRREGKEQGREEGRQVGREQGRVTGKIQLLQELLGETPTTVDAAAELDLGLLKTQLAELQQRLRERQA